MKKPGLLRVVLALFLLGIAFGYVEAAVVVYVRAYFEPLREDLFRGQEHDVLFPMMRFEQLQAMGDQAMHLLKTELGRELATMFLLAAAGLLVSGRGTGWLAGFMITFGVWDIFYYVFLKVLLNWPASMETWDILFLLPLPWIGPVWAPVLISVTMILAGIVVLCREWGGNPVTPRWPHWLLVFAGGAVAIVAFCWDYRNILAGGMPNPFNWPLFAVGEGIGVAGFLLGLGSRSDKTAALPK